MKPLIPGYLAPFILTGSVVMLSIVLVGIHRALKQAAWSREERNRTFWRAAFVLVGWFVVALITSVLGLYHATSLKTPTIQYALLTPIVLGVVLFWRWGLLRRVIEITPNEWLVGVQLYRVLGGIFLVLYATGYIPGFFALPAGIGDVIVGLLAPFVAAAYARGSDGAATTARWWNFAGLTDLVVAVGTGFLSSPSQLQLVAFDRPNNLISMFPLVMIPAFLVPLSVLLHFASLYKLRHEAEVRQLSSAALATPRG
jgi:hypothetical protein